jgi:hypothetical protein
MMALKSILATRASTLSHGTLLKSFLTYLVGATSSGPRFATGQRIDRKAHRAEACMCSAEVRILIWTRSALLEALHFPIQTSEPGLLDFRTTSTATASGAAESNRGTRSKRHQEEAASLYHDRDHAADQIQFE